MVNGNNMPYKIDPKTGKRIEIDPTTGQEVGMDASAPEFQQPEKKSVGGAAVNVVKSGVKAAVDLGTAAVNVFNPNLENNTVANLARTGAGAIQLMQPGEQGNEQYARAVGKFFDDRYGVTDFLKGDYKGAYAKVAKTLYEDPVGAAFDASVVLGGGGALLKGAGVAAKSSPLVRAGQTASRAGKLVDPLNAVGKVSRTAKIGQKVKWLGKILETGGKKIGTKSLGATGLEMQKFEDVTKVPLEEFMAKENLYGITRTAILKKVQAKIALLQKQYDKLVKTEKPVDVTEYSNSLRNEAKRMKDSSLHEADYGVAEALIAKADFIDAQAKATKGLVPSKIMANTKRSAFGKVNPSTMADAAAVSANKIAGGLAIEFLNKTAPGSAVVGKRLEVLRAFEKVVNKRRLSGRGGKLVSPAMGSIGLAATVTGFNSPAAVGAMSKGVQKFGQGIQAIPELASQTGAFAVPAVKTAAVATPDKPIAPEPVSGLTFSSGEPAMAGEDQVVTITNTKTGETREVKTSELGQYGLGESSQEGSGLPTRQEIAQLMIMDLNQGGKNIPKLKSILEVIDAEGGKENKPLSGTNSVLLNKATTALNSVNRIDEAITKEGKGVLVSKAFNSTSQKGRRIGADISSAIDVLGYFRTGAAITSDQRKDYIYMFPGIYDDEETITIKLQNLREEFKGYADGISKSGGTTDLQFTGGQPAF